MRPTFPNMRHLDDTPGDSAEEREDKAAIYRMLYGATSTAVTFRHRVTDIVHRVLSNPQAIGITWCGVRITRASSEKWATAVDEPVTCMACLAEET